MNSRSIKTIVLTAIVTLAVSFVVRAFLAGDFSNPLFSEAIAQTNERVEGSMPKNWGKLLQVDHPSNGIRFIFQADDGTIRLVYWDIYSSQIKEVSSFKRK